MLQQKRTKNLQGISKINPLVRKCNWKGIYYTSEKDDWNKFEESIQRLLLMFCMLKKKKYILPTFQNVTQGVKNKLIF